MNDLDLGATVRGFASGQKAFGRYVLQRLLGRGGMGVVWLARDEELEREVALKFLPEIVANDHESIRDLKRETRRSLELTHSHIVRIYDFLQDARTAAISMEFIAGDPLSKAKLDQPAGHFEVPQLREWVRQLLEALEYAHVRAEVVHRDLKPANLMIDRRGFLKVADFGIAASVSESVSRVSAQAGSSGTPLYMSPQQMMGEKPAVTDDIYAVGATLYELLTGKPPFYAGNIIAQVQGKVPPSMVDRRKDLGGSAGAIPVEWEAAVAACLAKDPKDRPQSAAELAEKLELRGTASSSVSVTRMPAQIETPASASVPPAVVPAPVPGARRWLVAPLAAGLLFACLILVLRCGEVLGGSYQNNYGAQEYVLGGVSIYDQLVNSGVITVRDPDGLGFLAQMFAYELGAVMLHQFVLGLGLVVALRPGRSASKLSHPAFAAAVGAVFAIAGELLYVPALLNSALFGVELDERRIFLVVMPLAGATAGWLLFRLAAGGRLGRDQPGSLSRTEMTILVIVSGVLVVTFGALGYFHPSNRSW